VWRNQGNARIPVQSWYSCKDFVNFWAGGNPSDLPECEMPLAALVVDDSMLIRHTVCRFLEERGFAVRSASNGVDALEILKEIHPDLIITDIQMPRMSGTELITALKSHPDTEHIPVIIVAGKQSGFEKTETRADFAIFKDIDIHGQLVKALEVVLGISAVQEKAASAQ
jgi:CheY-like chemotaxis protein